MSVKFWSKNDLNMRMYNLCIYQENNFEFPSLNVNCRS